MALILILKRSWNFLQSSIREREIDFVHLLQSKRCVLTDVTFRSLLFRRADMQPDAQLTEDERRAVEVLRKKFEPVSPSQV